MSKFSDYCLYGKYMVPPSAVKKPLAPHKILAMGELVKHQHEDVSLRFLANWFVKSIERGHYPPDLIMDWLCQCLKKVADGQDIKKSFLPRTPQRPTSNMSQILRVDEVLDLMEEGKRRKDAIEAVALKHRLAFETLEKTFKRHQKSRRLFREVYALYQNEEESGQPN